jgi:hypothetical protein
VAAGEADEGAEDVVEAAPRDGVDIGEIAEGGGDLEAGASRSDPRAE